MKHSIDHELRRAIAANFRALLFACSLIAIAIIFNAQWLIQLWILLAILLGAAWTRLDSRGKGWSQATYRRKLIDRVFHAFRVLPMAWLYPIVLLLSWLFVYGDKAGRAKT